MRAAWWWIDRWRTSVAYMTMPLAEQGAYRNLIDELWLRDGLLPSNERFLAMASGAGAEWPNVRAGVMAQFYETPEGWRNKTHDEVMSESKRRSEKQARWRSRAGNAGGNKDGNVTNNVTPSLSQSPDLDQTPDQDQKIPLESAVSSVPKRRAERKTDPLVLSLKTRLGSGAKICGDQIRALRTAGWDDPRIEAAIVALAEPGMAPWDWTKKARASTTPSPGEPEPESYMVRMKRSKWESMRRSLAEGRILDEEDTAELARLDAQFGAVTPVGRIA